MEFKTRSFVGLKYQICWYYKNKLYSYILLREKPYLSSYMQKINVHISELLLHRYQQCNNNTSLCMNTENNDLNTFDKHEQNTPEGT